MGIINTILQIEGIHHVFMLKRNLVKICTIQHKGVTYVEIYNVLNDELLFLFGKEYLLTKSVEHSNQESMDFSKIKKILQNHNKTS